MTESPVNLFELPGINAGVYTPTNFKEIQEMIYDLSGNLLPASKVMLVYSRISPLVRASKHQTFTDYIDHLKDDPIARQTMVEALTTNHTFFFREGHHFEHFKNDVRPRLLDDIAANKHIRLWSAGCSSGEEAYSLVMTLLGNKLDILNQVSKANLTVLATDLVQPLLETAKSGIYSLEETANIPKTLAKAWLATDDGHAMIDPALRKLVSFRMLNLLGTWPIKNQFDVIFCRNVMIYFDRATKEKLLERLSGRLKPDGLLYIGHSERLVGPVTTDFDPLGNSIYRKKSQ